MNIFIFTEGGKKYGLGHVARCSSIYQAFIKKGFIPRFLINGDDSVDSILKNVDFEIFNWLNDFSFLKSSDIVIIDSYYADFNIYEQIIIVEYTLSSINDGSYYRYNYNITVDREKIIDNFRRN